MLPRLLKSLAGLALSSVVAHAVTVDLVDFNSLAAGTNLGASYSSGGVTFVPTSGSTLTALTTPNGTVGLFADPNSTPFSTLRANIAGGATAVSVDLGDQSFDFGEGIVIGDADTIFLQIFNSSNVSLGYTSTQLANNFTGMVPLSLSANDIAYAVFGSISPDGSSVYADNFTYTGAIRTPDAGSTLALFAASLGLLGLAARARKSTR